MSSVVESLEGFATRRVTVLGDAILDAYLEGWAERVCREAPVPVVRLSSERFAPGGAANMAANLAAMGADVAFVSVVGDDDGGRRLRDELGQVGVDCSHVLVDQTRDTIVKKRLVSDGQLLVRFDTGSQVPISSAVAKQVLETLFSAMDGADALVVSDYRCGVLSDEVIASLGGLRQQGLVPYLVVDSTQLAAYRQLSPDLVKPSLAEALGQLALAPAAADSRTDLAEALGDALLDLSSARAVALTLDEDGAVLFERGSAPLHTPARFHGTAHPAGAGDTYIAAFTLAVASGLSGAVAADIGGTAAGVVVAHDGTSLCSIAELREAVAPSAKDKVCPASELTARAKQLHEGGDVIVFTNGCFDILHPGHIALLEQAKQRGDVLVVGVNSDESVAELKGPSRPVNSLADRLRVLAALSFVDLLVPFDATTADSLLATLRPHVYVKGGDYTPAQIPEAEKARQVGAKIEILPFFGNESTSQIIERIKSSSVGQAS